MLLRPFWIKLLALSVLLTAIGDDAFSAEQRGRRRRQVRPRNFRANVARCRANPQACRRQALNRPPQAAPQSSSTSTDTDTATATAAASPGNNGNDMMKNLAMLAPL